MFHRYFKIYVLFVEHIYIYIILKVLIIFFRIPFPCFLWVHLALTIPLSGWLSPVLLGIGQCQLWLRHSVGCGLREMLRAPMRRWPHVNWRSSWSWAHLAPVSGLMLQACFLLCVWFEPMSSQRCLASGAWVSGWALIVLPFNQEGKQQRVQPASF